MAACGVAVAAYYCISFLLWLAVFFRIRYNGCPGRHFSLSCNGVIAKERSLLPLTTYIANGNQISFLFSSLFFVSLSRHSHFGHFIWFLLFAFSLLWCVPEFIYYYYNSENVYLCGHRVPSSRWCESHCWVAIVFAERKFECVHLKKQKLSAVTKSIWWKDSGHVDKKKQTETDTCFCLCSCFITASTKSTARRKGKKNKQINYKRYDAKCMNAWCSCCCWPKRLLNLKIPMKWLKPFVARFICVGRILSSAQFYWKLSRFLCILHADTHRWAHSSGIGQM